MRISIDQSNISILGSYTLSDGKYYQIRTIE